MVKSNSIWLNQTAFSSFRQLVADTAGYDIDTYHGEKLLVGTHIQANWEIIGKVIKGDFIMYDRLIALDYLYGFIHNDKLRLECEGPRSRDKARKWKFSTSLHRHFGKTLDNVL